MAAATVNAAEVMADLNSWILPADRELLVNDRIYTFQRPFVQKFTIPSTSVDNAGDIVRLFKAPAGSYIWQWVSTPTDMDTGGSPALVYDIVATNDSDVVQATLVSGSTKAQAASGTDTLAAATIGKFIGNYWVALKVTTGAATPAAGTLTCAWLLSLGVITRSIRGAQMRDALA